MIRAIDKLDSYQRAIAKAHLAASGISIEALDSKPLIAIANSWNEICPGHEPLRQLAEGSWKNIKSWVSVEWSRHKFEKFITSQRNDRQNKYDRNKAPQDSPVNYDGFANAQNLIDAWRKRLCFCATKEARELAMDFKKELAKINPELAMVLVPNCVYRFGCPEFKPCGFFKDFLAYCEFNCYLTDDIQERYEAYINYLEDKEKGDWGKK